MSKIKKYIIRLISTLTLAVSLLLMFSCTENDYPEPDTTQPLPPAPEGYAYLNIQLPGTYDHLAIGQTKTRGVSGITAPEDLDPDTDLNLLPLGTTIWVLIQQYDADGVTPKGREMPYAYRVRAAETGSRNLERLNSTTEDRGDSIVYNITSVESVPVIIEKGFRYKFRMIAPAHELIYIKGVPDADRGTFRLWLDNGQSLMANDERYAIPGGINTTPVYIDINENASDRLDIELNPMIQQMARLHLSIHPRPDKGVHTTDLLTMGCVIAGLESGPKVWGLDTGKQFTPQTGPKRGNMIIRNYELLDRTIPNPEEPDKQLSYKSLEIIADIIPMNGTGNSLSIELNARINGVPVQLMTLIKDAILLHSRAYTANFNLSIDNGITVLNFTTLGWGTEVYPD